MERCLQLRVGRVVEPAGSEQHADDGRDRGHAPDAPLDGRGRVAHQLDHVPVGVLVDRAVPLERLAAVQLADRVLVAELELDQLAVAQRDPDEPQSFGFLVLFPLAFVSNAMVPTQGMPGWLRTIADWNPVSAVTAALRVLWGNPNPSAASGAWAMQHPVWTALAWSVAILLVSVPVATLLYRRRTTG